MIDANQVERAMSDFDRDMNSGSPIAIKMKQAREQLDRAIKDVESYAAAKEAGRSVELIESAVTEAIEHAEAVKRLMDSAISDMTHKQDFEKQAGQ